MRGLRLVVVALGLVILVGTCDDPAGGTAELRAFAPEYARVACQRIFSCCSAADRAAIDLAPYRTEAECLTSLEASIRRYDPIIEGGLGRFDADEGRRCLASLVAGACSALFTTSGGFRGCDLLVRGRGALGAPCDNTDIVCDSNWCHRDICSVRPACTRGHECLADQFCDAALDSSSFTCQPPRARGATCNNLDKECGPGGRCVDRLCVDSLADGQPCTSPGECSGTCSNLGRFATPGTCRPALCQGG